MPAIQLCQYLSNRVVCVAHALSQSLRCVLALGIFLSALVPVTLVHAHEQEEVRFLMNQVDRLEQRVLTLEQMLNNQATSIPGRSMSTDPASDDWDQLVEGMGEQQVLQILGRPGKVHEAAAKSTWFYPDLLGGSVFFENGRVTGWQKP